MENEIVNPKCELCSSTLHTIFIETKIRSGCRCLLCPKCHMKYCNKSDISKVKVYFGFPNDKYILLKQ